MYISIINIIFNNFPASWQALFVGQALAIALLVVARASAHSWPWLGWPAQPAGPAGGAASWKSRKSHIAHSTISIAIKYGVL